MPHAAMKAARIGADRAKSPAKTSKVPPIQSQAVRSRPAPRRNAAGLRAAASKALGPNTSKPTTVANTSSTATSYRAYASAQRERNFCQGASLSASIVRDIFIRLLPAEAVACPKPVTGFVKFLDLPRPGSNLGASASHVLGTESRFRGNFW